ncbi:ATPase subunit of ABC transporter with duplicated ATPase domains [Neorhizobium sp. 2083]|nr:ATPase subunit of ABC transporter with duplicated ATPase domains [Neorhizobium sp. 2083]
MRWQGRTDRARTLLSVITGTLAPFSGSVRVEVAYAFLDQKVSLLRPELSIRDNFMRLNSGSGENACQAALARFLFRGDAGLREVQHLSGGEMLRAGLACVLGSQDPPQLLILDEPTNHLDVDSIAIVEAGLRAYDGAMLVVSHDEAFLEGIGISRRLDLREQNRTYERPRLSGAAFCEINGRNALS